MPQLAPIVLNDGNTDVTYKPESLNQVTGLATLTSRNGSELASEQVMTVSARALNRPEGGRRARTVLVDPITRPQDGVDVVVGNNSGSYEFKFDAHSTSAERLEIVTKLRNAMDTEVVYWKAVLIDTESQY